MNDNIVKWKMPVDAEMTMERFKKCVVEEEFSDAIVLGFDMEGNFVTRSSKISRRDALWLIEQAKLSILGV